MNDSTLILKVKDIINSNDTTAYINKLGTILRNKKIDEKDMNISESQVKAWKDCFKFLKENLTGINKNIDLLFEYSLPGTIHERPDVIILTEKKLIILEFKRKKRPENEDISQVLRYKEWIKNFHSTTKERNLKIKEYIVCTFPYSNPYQERGVNILTSETFNDTLKKELEREMETTPSIINKWIHSSMTIMPDMLKAIELLYKENKLPYISDVNKQCLNTVKEYIKEVYQNSKDLKNSKIKKKNTKLVIVVDGVPGAGKTALGFNIIHTANKKGKLNAVYITGNGPLVDVLSYQLNNIIENCAAAPNIIRSMKNFKSKHNNNNDDKNVKILVFDEAQRAWDKHENNESEPKILLEAGNQIANKYEYAIILVLFGNKQYIYKGEEGGLSLWLKAIEESEDWNILLSDNLNKQIDKNEFTKKERRRIDKRLYLSTSIRGNSNDCSKWVNEIISDESIEDIKKEFEKINNTSFTIYLTRSQEKVKSYCEKLDENKSFGIFVSNFSSEKNIIFNNRDNTAYGKWFLGESKNLSAYCSVFGCQGLELDYPIIKFSNDYTRKNGKWIYGGKKYENAINSKIYQNPEDIVENNYRVLLTRGRYGMILFIPENKIFDETYEYFKSMGIKEL